MTSTIQSVYCTNQSTTTTVASSKTTIFMKPLPKQGLEPPSMRPRQQQQQQQHLSAASLKESEGVRNRGLVAATMSIVSASRHSSTSSSSERASSRDSHSHGSTAEGYSSCSEDGLETEDSPCQGSRSKKRCLYLPLTPEGVLLSLLIINGAR